LKDFYNNKSVLVTGGTGLIGFPLVEKLLELGSKVRVVSLDKPNNIPQDVDFIRADLRHFNECLNVVDGCEIVFQLAGVKGSPSMTMKQPASFFVPTIMFNTNMMEASRRKGVKNYLYTSSVGVYSPAEIFFEDSVWSTFPSENDRFAGWAKRMGELQAQSYQIEHNWQGVSIVRPANVYGPRDNFDPNNAMVIPSLIYRATSGENPLKVWGDGSAIRDFIYADDVAAGMLQVVSSGITNPVNLGSGTGVSIKNVTDILMRLLPSLRVEWDTTKPTGDAKRVMDTSRAKSFGIEPKTSLFDGIQKTLEWFLSNKNYNEQRYNSFTEFKDNHT
jgi:GDP-L-fucose synthase